MKKLNPPQVIILSFLSIILLGTILLCLPISTKGNQSIKLIDALFTSTSAVCVTGLTVQDTGGFFSFFGQAVIMCLFQAGGLGIMTFSMLFAILLGRKLTIKDNIVIQSALDHHKIEGLKTLVAYIAITTFSIELIGAVLIFPQIFRLSGFSLSHAIYYSIFHSISAFCNAGFCLFSNNLETFRTNTYFNFVISALIISGGLGFIVLLDIKKVISALLKKMCGKKAPFSICLQSKIVLSVTIFFLLAGTIAIFAFEKNNLFSGFSAKDKILASFFQSVTARTAGFNTVTTGALSLSSLFVIMMMMFVGASPGSTGGGIKTLTFFVLIMACRSILKNRNKVFVFKRALPDFAVRKSILIFILALFCVVLTTLGLVIIEKPILTQTRAFIKLLFEVISAFGTVGLSTGITPSLTWLGKLCIIITMFIGRLGPLTLVLAATLKEQKNIFKYPEERVMVG